MQPIAFYKLSVSLALCFFDVKLSVSLIDKFSSKFGHSLCLLFSEIPSIIQNIALIYLKLDNDHSIAI